MNNKLEVIGIDHGWSMMKTISQVFVTGVKEITTTPALFGDVLEYEGKSKECYVLLRVVRKIAKKKDKCEKQAIDNEFAIELDKDELKLFKGLFAEMFK